MKIKKLFRIVSTPLKHGWNLILFVVYTVLCAFLFLVASSGFIEIIKSFDNSESGMNTFISFIVLSLTLALLSYTASPKEGKNRQLFQKIGRNFSISTILFFIGFIAFKGINSDLLNQTSKILRIILLLVIAFALFYSIISFVFGLFLLLTVQTGLWNKFEKDVSQAKEWFFKSKYKRILVLILIIIYILIILLVTYKEHIF